MWRFVLAGSVLLVLSGRAGANGRPPGTSSIHFEQGAETNIVAGMTFGLVISHDGGATWQWMCEKAVGYGGLYDPSYAYSQSGALFATTFDGLKVNRNGCTFDATPPGTTFVSHDTLGPDQAFYFGAADPADAKIYKSTDDGMTFPTSAAPGLNGDWWDSIVVAPQDATRIYLSGYRLVKRCNASSTNPGATCMTDVDCPPGTVGSCENQKEFLLFKSVNGGTSFTALPTCTAPVPGSCSGVGITAALNSVIDFVGVSPANKDVVYARVSVENGNVGDGLYTMNTATDTTWTHMLSKLDSLAFVARSNGQLVAATPTLGAFLAADTVPTTWSPLASPPHINCLVENAAHEVWACTHNFDANQVPGDGFGIMKTTDLATWTGVLKYQDITAPVACAAGTPQADMCVGTPTTGVWCSLKLQLGITSSVINCPAFGVDSPPDGGMVSVPKNGCCDTGGGGGPAAAVIAGLVGLVVLRPRRQATL